MKMHGRIALALVLLFGSAVLVAAQDECDPEEVVVTAGGDTIFVAHQGAYLNCCLILDIDLAVDGFAVDFTERDVGEECDCLCCFDLHYDAFGFPQGHYLVRVWDEFGVLRGEGEVDVDGIGGGPVVGLVESGDCLETTGIEEENTVEMSWGRLHSRFR